MRAYILGQMVGTAWLAVAAVLCASVVAAQTEAPAAPPITAMDVNDVDLISGFTHFNLTDLSIGSGSGALTHTIYSYPNGFYDFNVNVDSFSGGARGTPVYAVQFGNVTERFSVQNGNFVSSEARGSRLTDNGDGTYTYSRHDGVVFTIETAYKATYSLSGSITAVRYPDGRTLAITYRKVTIPWPEVDSTTAADFVRIQSVTQNNGLQIKYSYALTGTPTATTLQSWLRLASVTAINNAVEYCDPAADTCALTNVWPTATYAWSVPASGVGKALTITDHAGRSTRYTMDVYGRVIGIKPPTSASADMITYTYCSRTSPYDCYYTDASGQTTIVFDKVLSAVRDGQTWNYTFTVVPVGNQYSEYRSRSPSLTSKIVLIGISTTGPLIKITTDDGAAAIFDTSVFTNRMRYKTDPELNETHFTYDSRSNIIEARTVAKPNTGLPDLITSAGYDVTCTNLLTCNKPNWVKDARQNQTDYTYDPTHGALLTETAPAVDGVRPQRRHTYVQRRAWVKNASGAYAPSTPIWVLSTTSYCRTGAASGSGCAVSGDETLTTYDYGPDSGPNNLFLRGVAVTADGQTLRTCYGYDERGNRISETKPRAGLTSCP